MKMQMRFDGTLGFAGGIVEPGETPEEAVNRELSEEWGRVGGVCSTALGRSVGGEWCAVRQL